MELRLAVADQPDAFFREGTADSGPDGFEERSAVLADQEGDDLPEVLVDIAGVDKRLDDRWGLGVGNRLRGRHLRSLGLVLLPQFGPGRKDAVLVDEGDVAQRGHLRPVVEEEFCDQTTSAGVVEVGKSGATDLKAREVLPCDVELRIQQTDVETPSDGRIGLGRLVPPVRRDSRQGPCAAFDHEGD
ncbi:hypothetical protein ABIE67_006932 [Streptomyces sp. V4I8]|uniref:hypothetical protein n=1 Tax=Streptomyces sp. V4I8 TaxID=3156469 RepID=UPI003519825C